MNTSSNKYDLYTLVVNGGAEGRQALNQQAKKKKTILFLIVSNNMRKNNIGWEVKRRISSLMLGKAFLCW